MRDGELEMLEPEGGKLGRRKKEVRDQRRTRRGEERSIHLWREDEGRFWEERLRHTLAGKMLTHVLISNVSDIWMSRAGQGN